MPLLNIHMIFRAVELERDKYFRNGLVRTLLNFMVMHTVGVSVSSWEAERGDIVVRDDHYHELLLETVVGT